MSKWCLSQLLEELPVYPSKKDKDLVFVVLLMEASKIEDHKLSNPS
jgi:hypothetical protein